MLPLPYPLTYPLSTLVIYPRTLPFYWVEKVNYLTLPWPKLKASGKLPIVLEETIESILDQVKKIHKIDHNM
jgi:hypothetical protein